MMKKLTDDEKLKWSKEIPMESAPVLIQDLVAYWQSKKGTNNFPLKSDIHPWEITRYVGRICILEVMTEPEDYIYRLDGSAVTESTVENLTGESILKAQPVDFAASAFMDMSNSFTRKTPVLWQIAMRHEVRQFDYLRLILPLSDKGEEAKFLMTYSHQLGLVSGELPRSFGNDVPSNIYD